MTARSGSTTIVHLSLALCNTVAPEGDALASFEGLADWYVRAGLSDVPPEVSDDDLRAVRTLRAGLRAALPAGDTAALAALAEDWLEGAPGCLCVDPATLQPRFTPGERTPRCLMVTAVLDALALGREAPGRVRVCAAEGCDALFVDTSRNGSRRWCSMERCGARAKAAAYYRRRNGGR
jgi:predicted RNA-binding Zn ribbon-like protein